MRTGILAAVAEGVSLPVTTEPKEPEAHRVGEVPVPRVHGVKGEVFS